MALYRELIKPKYAVHGLRTADLKRVLHDCFSNFAKIQYEMLKLIRGVIKKQKDKSFYRVTPFSWKWLWASICSRHCFKNPVISDIFKKVLEKNVTQPYILEEGVSLINQGLSLITLGLEVNI